MGDKVRLERKQFVEAAVEIRSTYEIPKTEYEALVNELGEDEALDELLTRSSEFECLNYETEIFEIKEDLDTDEIRVILS